MKIQLSDQKFKNKPNGKQAASITNEITNKICNISVSDFAKAVGEEGRTFTPAVFNGSRKKENFLSQQVFVLDFDEGIRPEEFLRRAEQYEIKPAVLYETFSSTKELPRFRAVLINDVAITDRRAAEIMIQMLCILFPEADQMCKDVARMFYGGKRILYCEEQNRIDIYNISLSMQAYIRDQDSVNYARNIKKIANELGVMIDEKLLMGIYKENEIEEKRAKTSIIIVCAQNSSKYIIEIQNEMSYTPMELAKNNPKHKQLRNKGYKDIYDICRLFRDFYEQPDLSHELKFLLASNLCHIKGGKKLFFDGLKQHDSKWKIDWKYMMGKNYKAMGCRKGGCPYADECGDTSIIYKLSRNIQKIEYDDTYIKLEEAEDLLKKYLRYAMDSPQKGIHLIKAQTALGKTYTYCKLLEDYSWQKPAMIVVPTLKLQEEIHNDLRLQGIYTFMTPNMEVLLECIGLKDLANELKEIYDTGYGYKVKEELIKYMANHKDELSEIQKKYIGDYLDFKSNLNGTVMVITTHAMFLSLDIEILRQYEIIVDEDILMTVFKGTASISFHELQEALKCKSIPGDIRQRIAELLAKPDGSTGRTAMRPLFKGELNNMYEHKLAISSSLPDFIASDTYYIDEKDNMLYYFKATNLPDVKMIIVSATLNPKIYEDYCRGRNNICSVQTIPMVKYKGTLKQYIAYSMSRSFIDATGFQDILTAVRKVVGGELKNMITFKKYSNQCDIYFGKTEGFNQYKGKDLIVLGTPHAQPVLYKLIGCFFHYCIDETMAVHSVENNGYKFPIMTFCDEKMRQLQFYFLESELEQAIGRARLLRYDCTVYLFSNYPCRGAEIHQEQYISDRHKTKEAAAA